MKFLSYFWMPALAATIGACGHENDGMLQGYAEGEYVRVAAPFAGSLQNLHDKRGSQVMAGEPFELVLCATDKPPRPC